MVGADRGKSTRCRTNALPPAAGECKQLRGAQSMASTASMASMAAAAAAAVPGTVPAQEQSEARPATQPPQPSVGQVSPRRAQPPTEQASGTRKRTLTGLSFRGSPPKTNLPVSSAANMRAVMKFNRTVNARKRERQRVPMPRGIDITLPFISEAWAEFQALDREQKGWIVWEHAILLVKKITKADYKISDLKSELDDFNYSVARKGVSFPLFAQWLGRFQANQRRETRRLVKEIFEKADQSRNGSLDKKEFAFVVEKAKKLLGIESFDLDTEWASINKVHPDCIPGDGDNDEVQEEISFSAFEAWWKDRAGIKDPDIPVLPEYMVMRIAEKAKSQPSWRRGEPSMVSIHHLAKGKRSKARTHWDSLGSRLRTMVDMRRQWGHLHEMYATRADSMYALRPLPRWIRDPDSSFSAVWDLTSVILLLYVSITVPLRAGFEIDIELWSVGFFVDLFVDCYFIADLIMNFRTAHYDKHGMREERPWRIATYYLKGWFAIDLFSCLPLGYLGYFMDDDESSSNLRAIKAFRLIRLSKMLRLARIKRILSKYGNNVNLQSYINIGFTVFIILFLAHILACFFYMIGTANETLDTGVQVNGWVTERADIWCVQKDGTTPCNATSQRIRQGAPGADLVVGTSTRYVASLYLVLNPLENCETTSEKSFGIFAELMRDMILGLIASLMTAIQLAMATTDAEVATKLKGLKQWLEIKKIPKSQQARTMEFFNELWASQPIDPQEMFSQMPPAMHLNIAIFMYRKFLSTVPLFRNLSEEVIAALCKSVVPLVALKGQEIIREGSTGTEMYMVMSGEVEVLTGGRRLGFLAEGAFFGEVPVLDHTSGSERRTRTVRSVTDSTELCFLTRAKMEELKLAYPELKARMSIFTRSGARSRATGKLTRKSLAQVGLSREEMDKCVVTYSEIKDAAKYVRTTQNWDDSQVIPFTMITAAVRMKKRASEARGRLRTLSRIKSGDAIEQADDSAADATLTPAPPAAPRSSTESALKVEVPALPTGAANSNPPPSRTGGLEWVSSESDRSALRTHGYRCYTVCCL